ncbi:hypothetical protein Tco_0877825 [Tanacetum coccineum]|uniref:Uncharacterized protein n=1 Tax=Tanacetum coccineum TaxID=301880 RepID=A0ABQ5C1Z5_9ASTR
MSRAAYNSIIKWELVYTGNNIVGKAKNLQVFIGCHSFLTDFIILENVNEFVKKGLTEVIFGKPFKEKIGLEEDISKGILWFKIGDDKTIFNMPRTERRLSKLTTEQQNLMSPSFIFCIIVGLCWFLLIYKFSSMREVEFDVSLTLFMWYKVSVWA